jgi:hypothetical protein
MPDISEIIRVYQGSNGDQTKALYASLMEYGPAGEVALNLFRAAKCSERAKGYRRRGHKDSAYDRKTWSMDNLCAILDQRAEALGIVWGWGLDQQAVAVGSPHRHVLYVEIPTGQVSFHTDVRGAGPDYGKPWDGQRGQSADRVCRWVARVFRGAGLDMVAHSSSPTDRMAEAARPNHVE